MPVYRFTTRVTPDKMAAYMQYVDIADSGCATPDDVLAKLKNEGVVFGIKEDAIREAFLAKEPPKEVLVASGTRAKDGKDGFVRFLVDVSSKPQFVPEDGGQIDFRKAMRVALVEQGQTIGEVVPPSLGDAGSTVTGAAIAPIQGAPARYFVGEGVEQQGNLLIAKTAGTPNSKSGQVTVKQIFEVQGDVDFRTGNINFPGTVIVNGSIIDGFEVQSEENLVVKGTVGASKLVVKGNIQVMGGILGKGKSEIRAGGFVEAKFCDYANILADGDVMITKDSLNSRLVCLGKIVVGGSIVGGEVLALHSVEAGALGSDVGTPTIVHIRTHYRQEKAKEASEELLALATGILERTRRWGALESLSEEELTKLLEDIKGLAAIMQRKKNIDAQIEKLEASVSEIKDAIVKAGIIYSDVVLCAPYCRHKMTDSAKGPVTVTESIKTGGMALSYG